MKASEARELALQNQDKINNLDKDCLNSILQKIKEKSSNGYYSLEASIEDDRIEYVKKQLRNLQYTIDDIIDDIYSIKWQLT